MARIAFFWLKESQDTADLPADLKPISARRFGGQVPSSGTFLGFHGVGVDEGTAAHLAIAGTVFSNGPLPWAFFEEYDPQPMSPMPEIRLTPGTRIELLISGPVNAAALRVSE